MSDDRPGQPVSTGDVLERRAPPSAPAPAHDRAVHEPTTGSGLVRARRALRRRRLVLAVGAMALLAGLASLAVSHLVFPHFSTNNDEPVYVFQARQ